MTDSAACFSSIHDDAFDYHKIHDRKNDIHVLLFSRLLACVDDKMMVNSKNK